VAKHRKGKYINPEHWQKYDRKDRTKPIVHRKHETCRYVMMDLTKRPIPSESNASYLPQQVTNHYGCINCEWKTLGRCPFGFRYGVRATAVDNNHPNGICVDRRNYLASFVVGESRGPHLTFAQWHRDFLMGKAAHQEQFDFAEVQDLYAIRSQLMMEVTQLESAYKDDMSPATKKVLDETKIKLKQLDKMTTKRRGEWQSLWREVTGFQEKQLDRNTPKKVETTITNKLTPEDIHDMVRDVEFKVVGSAEPSSSSYEYEEG